MEGEGKKEKNEMRGSLSTHKRSDPNAKPINLSLLTSFFLRDERKKKSAEFCIIK